MGSQLARTIDGCSCSSGVGALVSQMTAPARGGGKSGKTSDVILQRTGAIKNLPNNSGKTPADKYAIPKKPIGSGAYGAVYKVTAKSNKSQELALKCVKKESLGRNLNQFVNEVEINADLDHPNIIKLYETFEDSKQVYLVLEIANGGEMFDKIIEEGFFGEKEARFLLSQILKAVFHCHTKCIAHRDLKPENFLLADKGVPIMQNTLKVIDFGIAKRFRKDTSGNTIPLKTRAGTAYYIAPEVLNGRYTELCDVWSAGVILYILLSGAPPFGGETDDEIYRAAKKGHIDFSLAEFKNSSTDVKELIRAMCKLKVEERLSVEQVLSSAWMQKGASTQSSKLSNNFMKSLAFFTGANKFKKATLQVIAHRLNDKKIKDLRDVFMEMDKNGDGLLSEAEIDDGMKKVGMTGEQGKMLFNTVDVDNSGTVSYTEFLSAMLDSSLYLEEETCKEAFRIFDRDNDGSISLEELTEMLSNNEQDLKSATGLEEVRNIFAEADTNSDGQISFAEFMAMMRKGT